MLQRMLMHQQKLWLTPVALYRCKSLPRWRWHRAYYDRSPQPSLEARGSKAMVMPHRLLASALAG